MATAALVFVAAMTAAYRAGMRQRKHRVIVWDHGFEAGWTAALTDTAVSNDDQFAA